MQPTAPSDLEFPDLTRRQLAVTFGALMTALVLASLDQTIVSTALPRITGDLGDLEHLSWVVAAYLLASTIAMPLYGKLGDLFGRKLLFQVAIGVFLAGSVLAGVSQSMGQLIAFRFLQGLGGGGLMVLTFAIIGETVSPRERGRYQGYFGAAFSVSSIAGPLLGGFITDNLSWRWVFYVNVPLGVVALAAITLVIPNSARHIRPTIDWLGASLLAVGVTLLVLVTTWGGTEYAWGSGVIVGLSIATVILLGLFVVVELRSPEPIVPLRVLRDRTCGVAVTVSFILGMVLFGSLAFLPLFLQVVTGASATNSGLSLFPMMGGVFIASIVSGRIITRTGRYRWSPILGTAVGVVALTLLTTIDASTSRPTVGLYMFVLGSGMGLTMQVVILAAQNAVPITQIGAVTGSVSFFREIGGSIGIAICGAVFSNGLHRRLGSFDVGDGHLSIARIRALPDPERLRVIDAIADSVANVFTVVAPILLVGAIVTWLLHELPLRRGTEATVEDAATVEVGPGSLVEVSA